MNSNTQSKTIGCLTWHRAINFGSNLQAYALQTVLQRIGHHPVFIDYYKNNQIIGRLYLLFVSVRSRLCMGIPKRIDIYHRFQRKFLCITAKKYNKSTINNCVKLFDAFICGSDQIWAPNVFDKTYMLDFVPRSRLAISYAASIGLNDIPRILVDDYKSTLSKLSKVSVREATSQALLKTNCGIESIIVADPTLLLCEDDWRSIEKSPSITCRNYGFCYFLNSNNQYFTKYDLWKLVDDSTIIGISENKNDRMYMENLINNTGPAEFVWLVHNSNYVITDSYHGAIFAFIFHKPLLIIPRFKPDDSLCQNSRIVQLCNWFNASEAIASDSVACAFFSNFRGFDSAINELRSSSIDFLEEALR